MKPSFYIQTVLVSSDIFIARDYTKILDASRKILLAEHFENTSKALLKSKRVEMADVLLFDLYAVEISDLNKLKVAFPDKKILVIDADTPFFLKVMAVGVDGFLSNRKDFKSLLDQISAITKGEKALDQTSMNHLFQHFKRELQSDLTSRELEVLEELSLNKSYKQIADKLAIGTATVKTHLERAYDKLDAVNKFDAVDKARAKKLI